VVLFWFRRDLRLSDNAGLFRALELGIPVQPVFIFDRSILDRLEDRSDARVQFIHGEVERLREELQALGANLWYGYGIPEDVHRQWIVDHPEIQGVFANRDYEPYARERDARIEALYREGDRWFKGAKDHVVFEKSEVVKPDGLPYTVFTPYSRRWRAALEANGIPSYPSEGLLAQGLLKSEPQNQVPSLESVGFAPSSIAMPPKTWSHATLVQYAQRRDIPSDEQGTTRLGLHLRFGTISVRALLRAGQEASETFVNELIWRDFYQMVLYHFPESPKKAIKPAYDRIEWESNEAHFAAWCEGQTGYPMVDAGMRQLNTTGYMHNRVRMVVASFLTKHLLIDWRWGEAYFAQKLLDFDQASNVGGWQWASGSGTDAAPYFRIFNPQSQLEKFDRKLEYVHKWVPEYGTAAYPSPIVDHAWARQRCLERYKSGLGSTQD
jgi:deoxyribodipyrimidine photo-lyase